MERQLFMRDKVIADTKLAVRLSRMRSYFSQLALSMSTRSELIALRDKEERMRKRLSSQPDTSEFSSSELIPPSSSSHSPHPHARPSRMRSPLPDECNPRSTQSHLTRRHRALSLLKLSRVWWQPDYPFIFLATRCYLLSQMLSSRRCNHTETLSSWMIGEERLLAMEALLRPDASLVLLF